MQLLETTIVHRILETLNWTRHNPHEEGNTTEPGSPRTAETAQLNGTAGGHRPTAKKNCRWEAAETVLSNFASLGGAGSVTTRPHLLELRASPNKEFLIAPTPCLRPLLLHSIFGGGQVPLFMPNHGFRRSNVPRTPVIPPARHGNCCKIQPPPRIGRPGLHARASPACGPAVYGGRASMHAGRTHAPPRSCGGATYAERLITGDGRACCPVPPV